MKILFTHRYYWPDTPPYALMLRELTKAMVDAGHEVFVYASRPSYRPGAKRDVAAKVVERGASIRRGSVFGSESSNVLIRILNVIMYCSGLFVTILRIRPDAVTAATYPPVLASWVASLACRIIGARFIYHMQDIHPEVSQYSGGFLGKGIANKILHKLDNQTLRRSSVVVVLSEDMAATVRARGVDIKDIQIINNPSVSNADGDETPPLEFRKQTGITRVIFAGNLGRFQNLMVLTKGVAGCFEEFPNLELVFLGDGNVKPKLMERWGSHSQVKFFPFLPFTQAKVLIEEADIGLVSLQENIYKVSFPSKFTTYVRLGLPLLVLVEAKSILAKTTESNGLGVVPDEMTDLSITTALKKLINGKLSSADPSNWYESNCSLSANQNAWLDLFKSIGG